MTLWRCLLTTSANHPGATNKIKSQDLNMTSVFAWGQVCPNVKSLIWQTVSLLNLSLEFEIALRHNGLFATFLNSGEVSVFYIVISLFSPNLPFPVFSLNKPSNGNTLLYNHVLASQRPHLHNWACANWTCKLCAVTLAGERADSWIMFPASLFSSPFKVWCSTVLLAACALVIWGEHRL